jgi:adenylate cyclase
VTSDPDPATLFEGLDGEARAEREELVRWLLDHHFDVERIAGAISPMLLGAVKVWGDDGTLVSAQDVAESSGVPVELILRLHHAAGLAYSEDPHNALHPRVDAEAILPAASLIGLGIDPAQVVLVVRLLVEGLTQAAVAMRLTGLKTILSPGAREVELAQAYEQLAQESKPITQALILQIAGLTLRHSFETEAITLAERSAGRLLGTRHITVAFADVVGFTQLGEELPPEELGEVVDVLVNITHDAVTEPVRFVKTIGDAVMLVSPDPGPLVHAVLGLIDIAAENSLQLRAGIASGAAASRAGDWYGSPVNVASRITDVAPPGTVWAAESTRTAANETPGIVFSFTATRNFRGVRDATRLFSVARSAP